MEKELAQLLARDLAEATASMWRTTDKLCEATGWEIGENFTELSILYRIFIDMVGGVLDDYSFDMFSEFANGEIDYDTLLIEVRAEVL